MKRVAFLSLLALVFTACHAHAQQQSKSGKETTITHKTPQGNWTVHKKYDQNGNLIEKDSVYSYSYSSVNGKPVPQNQLDSLQKRFYQHMRMGTFPGFQHFFAQTPQGAPNIDSLQNSFFSNGFGMNISQIQQHMMQQMRAMRQHFMQQAIPHRRYIPRKTPHKQKKATKATKEDKQATFPTHHI